ncbi:MAG: hypothetical protein ACI4TT_00640 [Christensenellales bacterium]
MKNKYIKQITDEDIKKILDLCGYGICENLTDENGGLINAVDRFANKIMVRCVKQEKPSEKYSEMAEVINKRNPELASKLLSNSASTPSFLNIDDAEILVLEDFMASFPFDLEQDDKKSKQVNDNYLNYCLKKFGMDYVYDYIDDEDNNLTSLKDKFEL